MIELLNGPGFFSEKSTIGSDVSYIFSVTFTTLFLISGVLARKKHGLAHHRMILVSMIAMLAYFAFYYQVRRLGVQSLSDQIKFAGPEWVFYKVFMPALYAHFFAVSLSIFLALYMIANGFRTAVTREGAMILENRTIGRSKFLWLAGFVWLGVIVWWLFFKHTGFGFWHRAMFLSIGYFIPAGIMLLIGKVLPESEKRHRVIGRLCLLMFALLLVTTTLVTYLLYIAY